MNESRDDDSRTSAIGLFNFAESYRDCADLLATGPPPDLIFEAPIEFLFWHALELYYKAFLRASGVGVKELRKDFGHSLSRLHAACVDRGLTLSQYPEAFFDFADPNEPFDARYIRTGYKMAKPSIQALKAITAEVGTAVGFALKAKGEPVRPRVQ